MICNRLTTKGTRYILLLICIFFSVGFEAFSQRQFDWKLLALHEIDEPLQNIYRDLNIYQVASSGCGSEEPCVLKDLVEVGGSHILLLVEGEDGSHEGEAHLLVSSDNDEISYLPRDFGLETITHISPYRDKKQRSSQQHISSFKHRLFNYLRFSSFTLRCNQQPPISFGLVKGSHCGSVKVPTVKMQGNVVMYFFRLNAVVENAMQGAKAHIGIRCGGLGCQYLHVIGA